VSDALLLIVLVQVAGRLGEGAVRPASEHHAAFLFGHGGDDRPGILWERLARHPSADGHHHVDDQVEIVVDNRVAVELQIAKRPAFIEHTDAHFGIPSDDSCFPPIAHRGHEQLVRVRRDVVHDRHRGSIFPPGRSEHAGAVGANELPAL
jgi:hypothetical protein